MFPSFFVILGIKSTVTKNSESVLPVPGKRSIYAMTSSYRVLMLVPRELLRMKI
jgi:hypothetical protein